LIYCSLIVIIIQWRKLESTHWSIMMIKKLLISTFLIFSIPAIAAAQGAVDLTPKFIEGKSYQYETEADISALQKMPGNLGCDIRYKGNIKSRLHYKVNKVFEDQNAEIAVTLINPEVKFSIICEGSDSPMNFDIHFDSAQKPENELSEFQAARAVLDCLDQSTFVFKVTPKGKVLESSGIESFTKNMNEELSENNHIPEGASQSICSWVKPEYAETFISLITQFLPESPVNVGDSWESVFEAGNFNITQNWHLASADQNRVVIKERTPLDLGKNNDEMFKLDKFSGEQQSQLTLEAEDNWVLSTETQAEFHGRQSLNAPFSDKPLEIETSIEAKFNFKRLDL
jgi:hypothetical protein